jgi:NADH dehydrogenase FAD-containing subunit
MSLKDRFRPKGYEWSELASCVTPIITGTLASVRTLRERLSDHKLSVVIIATIGHHRAVAQFGHRTFSGLIAWLLWSLVHTLFC